MTATRFGRFAFGTLRLLPAACIALGAAQASAAGFDTPILYSARHQAMGGTAIAAVNDPSAGFHNPAGLQGVKGLAALGDFSLILGKVRSAPDPSAGTLESSTVVAPFFMLGAAYRVHPWLTAGLAVFPVASGGAEYEYDIGSTPSIDSTEIVFFEATPMLSLNVPQDQWLPGKLAFGAGYRASMVQFDRQQGATNDPQILDLALRGFDWTGFRVGVQYAPIEALKFGVVFRNKVQVTTKADTATVVAQEATNGELEFTLPAKVGFGARYDWRKFGLASDVEWAFQSQNKRAPLKGTLDGTVTEVPNVFDWQNGVTWRMGLEYRLGEGATTFPLRVGYIYDTKVTNRAYPSAFGTPPAPTNTFTAGAGFVQEKWQVNLAFTRRVGKTKIAESELGEGCAFCSYAGSYKITMTGLYADVSVDLPM